MRPVAVIACNYEPAVNYLHDKLKIVRVNKARRSFIDRTGIEYIIFTELNQLRGYEFSDVWTAPGAGFNPDYIEMFDYAKIHVR